MSKKKKQNNKSSIPNLKDSLSKLKGYGSTISTSSHTTEETSHEFESTNPPVGFTKTKANLDVYDRYDNLKTEIYEKLTDIREKYLSVSNFRWWIGGIISAFLLFCYLIFQFVYLPTKEEINKNDTNINKRIDDVNNRIETINKNNDSNKDTKKNK